MREHESDDNDQRHAQQPKNDWHQSLHCYRSTRINQSRQPLQSSLVPDLDRTRIAGHLGALERMDRNQFLRRKVLGEEIHARGMCYADSHLDCDHCLHVGNCRCVSATASERRTPSIRTRSGTHAFNRAEIVGTRANAPQPPARVRVRGPVASASLQASRCRRSSTFTFPCRASRI
jgi:hypothetical protein